MMPTMEILYPFSQPIHPLAIEVCYTLQQAGYQAYIVGGCVRDLHLGITPKDWDITTDASPEDVVKLFPRTLPTGLQHGTVTVCMAEGEYNHFEVTTFRVEGKYLDGRRPESVKFVKNLTEDLARRDLTINAIAFDPISNIGADPFGGEEDLRKGIIRTVGSPQDRFQEDGLRIMRVARFAARLGYFIEPSTLQGMKDNLETLKKVSKERIGDEFRKILTSAHPYIGVSVLQCTGVLPIICPLLKESNIPLFPKNVDLETQVALLYNNYGTSLVKKDLLELKFSNKEIRKVIFLLDMLISFRILIASEISLIDYKKFIARFKNKSCPWEVSLEQFIHLSNALQLPIKEILLNNCDVIVLAREELSINGNDLMEIGIIPGPNLKKLLDKCYQEILEHPEHNTKEFLTQFALESNALY